MYILICFIISYMTIYDQKMTKRSASNNKKQNGICLIADL